MKAMESIVLLYPQNHNLSYHGADFTVSNLHYRDLGCEELYIDCKLNGKGKRHGRQERGKEKRYNV